MGARRGPGSVGPLDFSDIASFQFQGYVLRYRGSTLEDALRLGSTDISKGSALVVSGGDVYVSGDYSGFLDIGNETSLEARGLETRGFVARFTPDLRYQWHVDSPLYSDVESLAAHPSGGVYVTTDMHDAFYWLGETEATGVLVADGDGQTLSHLTATGHPEWLTRVCRRCGANVYSAGDQALVASSYAGMDFPLATIAPASGWDAYAVALR